MTQTIARPWSPVQVLVLVLVGVLISALALAVAVPAIVQAQSSDAIEYPENGKDPVVTLSADDPEGGTSITWDIAAAGTAHGNLTIADAADAGHFDINKDGELTFDIGGDDDTPDVSVAPDFEAPRAAAFDASTNTNTYRVVVSASDGTETGYHAVTVKVTNEDEPGKVTWTVDHDADASPDTPKLAQFDVGTILTASATDGDIAGTAKAVTSPIWRWHRSTSKTDIGTEISGTGANAASYTVTLDDVDMYLTVVAHYVVSGNVDQETAMLSSEYPVLPDRVGASKLEFDPTTVSRSVAEGKKGANVGDPVTAKGNHGAVNYTLAAGGTDNAQFKIDQKSGQITTNADLNFEGTEGTADNCSALNTCVVTVTATDASGASVTTDATVNIKITNVDEKPTFPTAAVTAVTLDEGGTVLATDPATVTYTATDPETRSISYTLMGSDGARFQLSTSQVLSFRAKPDYEKPTDSNRDNVYEVTVRASDGTMHADRTVKVTVRDDNEAPDISGRDSVNFAENGTGNVATFMADDPEGATAITWDIAAAGTAHGNLAIADAADAEHFDINKDGELTFDIGGDSDSPDASVSPDFEAPRGTGPISGTNTNTYRVVVSASDGTETGYHAITVKVTNMNERGKVVWTVDHDGGGADTPKLVQFDVGTVLSASATDGDIAGTTKDVASPGAASIIWRWYRGGTLISTATTESYTVVTTDVGHRIRVVVTYNVGGSTTQETAGLTSDYPVLAERVAPNALKFEPSAISRSVPEGKKGANVGTRVLAEGNHGAVNYTLVPGGDAANFKIDQKTGQITTAVDLDYEAVAGDPDNCVTTANECTVTVRATDASGTATAATAQASPPIFEDATVTIKITKVDEKPTFGSGAETVSLPENSKPLWNDTDPGYTFTTSAGVTYTASDEDGLNVNLSLMGPDAAKFTLNNAGILSFRTAPDYEDPGDVNKNNVYEVTVRASDGTVHTDRMVRVTVTGLNEAPVITREPATGLRISGRSSVSVAENATAVETYTARGPDADMATWGVTGDDAGKFSISSSGALSFRSAPNYENPGSAAGTNVYSVTVTANDGTNTAMHPVTVTVTDVEETGTGDALVDRYDADTNGTIEKSEVVTAIDDYLDGGENAPSKADVIRLINLYLDA